MDIEETELRPRSRLDSGLVRQFKVRGRKTLITQISTFCPDTIGPGPTNLYLIENDALVLVDAGIPTYLAKMFFYHWRNQPVPQDVADLPDDFSEREFNEGMQAAGYSVSDLDLLLISHGHPDHFLMARAILNQCDALVAAHILDTPGICNPWSMLYMWFSRRKQMSSTGMPPAMSPEEVIGEDLLRGLDFESLGVSVRVEAPIFRDGPLTVGGQTVEGVEVVHLPGHSPGSVGLLLGGDAESKILICGDVLLNPITPHPDDLLVYLQTVDELSKREDIALVLPAHGRAIRNLKSRTTFLRDHHRRRLEVTYEACKFPRCVWDLATMPDYFDTYVNPTEFNFLAGLETLVHMEVLTMVGGLHRTHIKDEVHYFQNCGEPFEHVYERVTALVADKRNRALMRY
jgi:glyoxylase-like metal-dependent hydrolase (beta-lactamase superfamily II)